MIIYIPPLHWAPICKPTGGQVLNFPMHVQKRIHTLKDLHQDLQASLPNHIRYRLPSLKSRSILKSYIIQVTS